MKISNVKTMTRVGKVIKHDTHPMKLKFEYDSNMPHERRRDKRGRVYTLTVDEDIAKIGGSQDQGGIEGTVSAYFGGFAKKMSLRTYCVWNFMKQAIEAGKTVEVYCVWADVVTTYVPTMYGAEEQTITVDYHAIENNFVKEFVRVEGKFPDLNMQEAGRKWIDTGLSKGYPGMGN